MYTHTYWYMYIYMYMFVVVSRRQKLQKMFELKVSEITRLAGPNDSLDKV